MSHIALIPARSGSKRLKDKNLSKILDLELFLWSVRAAAQSKLVDRVVFSTDSDDYINLCLNDALKLNYQVSIDKRSNEEAGDKVKIYDYIRSNQFISRNNLKKNDSIVLLMPTCPLRPKGIIDQSIKKSIDKTSPTFTCCEYDFHVSFAFSINESESNRFEPLFKENSPMVSGNTRSQDQKIFYRPNGSAYVIPLKYLIDNQAKSIYFKAEPLIMDTIFSCDVDTLNQLKIASATAESIKDELSYILYPSKFDR